MVVGLIPIKIDAWKIFPWKYLVIMYYRLIMHYKCTVPDLVVYFTPKLSTTRGRSFYCFHFFTSPLFISPGCTHEEQGVLLYFFKVFLSSLGHTFPFGTLCRGTHCRFSLVCCNSGLIDQAEFSHGFECIFSCTMVYSDRSSWHLFAYSVMWGHIYDCYSEFLLRLNPLPLKSHLLVRL